MIKLYGVGSVFIPTMEKHRHSMAGLPISTFARETKYESPDQWWRRAVANLVAHGLLVQWSTTLFQLDIQISSIDDSLPGQRWQPGIGTGACSCYGTH